jgi:hypothetical protein
LINKDADTANFVDTIAWVPTFIYVEDDEIKLVTFGRMESVDVIKENVDIAFE